MQQAYESGPNNLVFLDNKVAWSDWSRMENLLDKRIKSLSLIKNIFKSIINILKILSMAMVLIENYMTHCWEFVKILNCSPSCF